MAIEGTIFGLVLGLAGILVLLRYAGILHLIQKPACFIAAGVMFYIIDLCWGAGTFTTKLASEQVLGWITFVWELVAFLLVAIGCLWATIELMRR